MRVCEKSARTIDEAIRSALAELGVGPAQAEIEVLKEPSKGLFGLIGNKLARVKIKVKETPIERACFFIKEVADAMGINVKLEVEESDEIVKINFNGDDLGILIGRRGDTLDALQYLVNLVANRKEENRVRMVLDVEGYRRRREQTLQNLAVKLADKVRRRGQEVVLEPMNPHERRIIHTTLQNNRFVYTTSQGEEPFRKIIIAPKK
ncbi:MAG: RNA-binding cell elongation regulator Jag/EloR [Carboxydocellales bacterium]